MKSMNVKTSGLAILMVLAVALVATSTLLAQAPPPPPHGMPMMGGPMGGEFGDGKTVTGSPLSGTLIVTRDTTLADGNKIHNESQAKVYRDAEGRVRREMGVDLVTPATGPVKHNLIVISDPVSGNRYMLNPDNKTARQMPLHGGHHAGEDHQARMDGPAMAPGGAGEVTKEQLGNKAVNGLQAEGVRVTRTIPPGTMGNEKAIVVVTERWYSPDLLMAVMTVHTDPMMGTVTTKLVNVTQGAPDASLFQVPSDYTLEAGKPGDPMYVPMKP